MLDRQVVKEFLENKLTDWNTLPPPNLDFDKLVEVFCLFVC